MKKDLRNNIELEQALLGALLMDPYHLPRIPNLRPQHFYEPVHQRIFEALCAAADAGETPTPLTMKHRFENDPALEGLPPAYLGQLAASALAVADARDCEREIISLWRSRKLQEAWTEGLAALETCTAEETAATVNEATHQIISDSDSARIRNCLEVSEAILEDMKSDLPCYSTGIAKLDAAMGGGLFSGMAYGFAARKKVGKTMLASTIACNLNLANVKHLFICGEMGAKEIHQRILARISAQYPSGFRTRQKDAIFGQAIADAAVRAPRCTYYLDAPGVTFEHLRRACASALATKGIKGIILDYWQLVGGKEPRQSTSEHLDGVAQWIADFCRKHQLWAIVMAQINQDGNTRGSEGIRLAFDQVYQLNPLETDKGLVWMQMLDTRYTAWSDVGSEMLPAFRINPKGPFFEET